MIKKISIACLFALFIMSIFSCRSYEEREIHGHWFSKSWTSDGSETGMRAWMAFEEDGSYRALFQDNKEQGQYWIEGYKLFTDADNSEKIVTRIERLDGDTLVIAMNRGGASEEILFVRGTVNQIGDQRETDE